MQKTRVLYIITTLNIGGAEMMLCRMLGCINRSLFEPVVVSLMDKGALGGIIETELKVPVHGLGLKGWPGLPLAVFSLRRVISSHRPHIVHSHMVHANLFARITRLLFRYPLLICTVHSIDEKGRRKTARWRELAYRLTDWLCDYTTQVSRAGLEKYVAIKAAPRHKIAFMPNGVDLSLFTRDPSGAAALRDEIGVGSRFVFLAVGSLNSQKDYPNLLQAFAELAGDTAGPVLIIAGEGPLRSELELLCRKLDLSSRVFFLGLRSDIPALMNMADVFIMSSSREGMPIVLLEASSAALPIITTDVGGNSEVVLDKQSGFVVPPRDYRALAGAMAAIMAMTAKEREAMGLFGYNFVKKQYAIDKVIKKWESFYQRLLEAKGLH